VYYVYVLKEIGGERFYIGSTSDLRKRVNEHNQGKTQSTRNRQWQLVYYEAYITEAAARKRETKLKQHGKAKQALMQRIKESLD
jgi:putative endonuclease